MRDKHFNKGNDNVLSLSPSLLKSVESNTYLFPKSKQESNINLCIISKFSNFSFIKNKKQQYENNLIALFKHYLVYRNNRFIGDSFDKDFYLSENNLRDNLSGVASIVFINKNLIYI